MAIHAAFSRVSRWLDELTGWKKDVIPKLLLAAIVAIGSGVLLGGKFLLEAWRSSGTPPQLHARIRISNVEGGLDESLFACRVRAPGVFVVCSAERAGDFLRFGSREKDRRHEVQHGLIGFSGFQQVAIALVLILRTLCDSGECESSLQLSS